MRILILGSGGREHALAQSIKRSDSETSVFCLGPTINPGIRSLAAGYWRNPLTHLKDIETYAQENHIDMVVVGPEQPLQLGVADVFSNRGINVFGPTKNHARIETSKGFARSLLAKYAIKGNPNFHYFNNMKGVIKALEHYGENCVIKADGLCGGKGVLVWGEHIKNIDQAIGYCKRLQRQGFVIEEKLEGEEFSLLSFSDGDTLQHMPMVQDHKRAYAGDTGPNTGGMGTYSDSDHLLPFLCPHHRSFAERTNEAVVEALQKTHNAPYKGIIYGSFMATKDAVKIIEYNARFGDPEALNLLRLLQTDMIDILQAISSQTLHRVSIKFKKCASVCKYIVPLGYPQKPIMGSKLDIGSISPSSVDIFLGSVEKKDRSLITMGSRSLAVLAIDKTIEQAETKVESAISQIKGSFFHRSDIATKNLIKKRIAHMKRLYATKENTLDR